MDQELPMDSVNVKHGGEVAAAAASGSSSVTLGGSMNREKKLQQLLAEERHRSEQRKDNYLQLRDEQIKLRKDYLNLQSEIKSILEETRSLKKQKEDQLEAGRKQIDDQEKLIEKLRKELNNLSQEYERAKLIHKAETNEICKEKEELRVKLLELTKTPEGQRILTLSGEVETLSSKLKCKEKALEEATRQYAKIQDTIESFTMDQEKTLFEHERQIEQLRGQLAAVREDNLKLDDLVKHIRREKEKLKLEIKRYERDMESHEKTLVNLQKTFELEKERIRRSFVKEKSDLEIERDSLSDQIKRMKIDLELKAERINCLEKTIETKEKEFQLQMEVFKQQESNEKSAMERERLAAENRIAEMAEDKRQLKVELDECKRQLETNHESRMNLQKEVMLSKTKVESFECLMEEVGCLRRGQGKSMEELNKVRNELMTISATNKDLTVQLARSEVEYNRLKTILEEERKESLKIRKDYEDEFTRLRTSFMEERNQAKMKIDDLNGEIRKKHKEREEIKLKCKQYQSLVEKLRSKLQSLEDDLILIKQSTDDMVPIKA